MLKLQAILLKENYNILIAFNFFFCLKNIFYIIKSHIRCITMTMIEIDIYFCNLFKLFTITFWFVLWKEHDRIKLWDPL